jgi:hypothetical protein
MGQPVYNRTNYRVERVFFTDTATLQAGQPLCYQPVPTGTTRGFAFDVQLPTAGNRLAFAGIVSPSFVGVTGPASIDIYIPQKGDLIQVLVGRAADVPVGSVLLLNNAVGQGAWSAFAASTVATSVAQSVTIQNMLEQPGLNVALESVPSTATVNARQLAWVRFL